jgi:pimeloyl-ACP methyl ester carboxylesterase
MGDMQINAEYVAYSLHHISQLAGGLPTAVVAHSQGGPNTQWALQFFPSTRAVTRAFIALSPDFAGIELLHSDSLFSDICATGLCQAALWQQGVGSQYYRALHAGDFRALVPTTSIWSQFDGVVAPFAANARLPGATVLAVQSLCPLRPEYHVTMTISAAVWAIALDALRHGGTADLGRVLPTALGSCLRVAAKNMNSNIAKDLGSLFTNLIDGFL